MSGELQQAQRAPGPDEHVNVFPCVAPETHKERHDREMKNRRESIFYSLSDMNRELSKLDYQSHKKMVLHITRGLKQNIEMREVLDPQPDEVVEEVANAPIQ